jgi:tRNA(Ile)-lysidine synthase TilS/MesJ
MFALPPAPAVVPSLLIGFSGGLDSTVLLHRLHAEPAFQGVLRAIHIHHGLQPAADDWAAHCQRTCDAWEVPLRIVQVRVSTDSSALEKDGKSYSIIPGMICTVEIMTGRKTILSYLLKPINKARDEALRER